ncbi:cupin-like domain-containing protein [Lacinutrix sp. C3R15]|uniref:cupin-like domain-containing protein n=1 Tax=Flavobacteriaceae TaxID=49546 RepID=UPI001C087FC7|nr:MULTISPECIES: cupin-like domain-containing protein [Flavobacteriaceae]MBU2938189.1 cupin-like domain-containing protein [Lacinutrix sp. C3R15]MDO6621503.1 cupin-like domain-containing protein [Oceanihabitans sp. 1_MG-2023]
MAPFKLQPIDRVKNITKANFVKNYYKPQRPVLIENLTQDWNAYHTWNLDYIQSLAGDQVVPLYNNEATKGKQKSAEPATEMKLYDYIEILKTKPTDLRIFFYDVMKKMPVLAKDFKYPDMGLKFFQRLPVLFFGSKGSQVLTHYDMDLADLVHFHFHGTKRVTLFSPEQTKFLYKIPYAVHNLEEIDMANPDFNKYPGLQHVEAIQVEMKHGDALYMPSGYWHFVEYLDAGFSMSLRAFTKKPKTALNMLYNVFFMRHFENIMRKWKGQKWIDYKNNKAIEKVNKTLENLK